jgi:hypothetical protein
MQAKLRAPEDGLGRIGFIGFRLPRCGYELSRRRLHALSALSYGFYVEWRASTAWLFAPMSYIR